MKYCYNLTIWKHILLLKVIYSSNGEAVALVFSVRWSYRNQSNVLIWLSILKSFVLLNIFVEADVFFHYFEGPQMFQQ